MCQEGLTQFAQQFVTALTAPLLVGCVVCSGDLVVHLLQGGRGGISGSEVMLLLYALFNHPRR